MTIKSYSVHGMKGSTDPPAVTDGVFTVKIISADYGENPLSTVSVYCDRYYWSCSCCDTDFF